MKLTENFTLEEFVGSRSCTNYQKSLLKILATQLQDVRDQINLHAEFKKDPKKKITMTISSGLRTSEDYNRLKANGYNPSARSDHFCGLQMEGVPTLGAADVVFSNLAISYQDLFKFLIELNEAHHTEFGQIILEFNPKTKSYWIHFGNNPKKIFSDEVVQSIYRKKYLISYDNGKTYEEVVL